MGTDRQEWDEVADAVRGLALTLKLHFEQTASETTDDVKGAVDTVSNAVESAFDALRAAVEDPAVKEDVRDVASRLRAAVSRTLRPSD